MRWTLRGTNEKGKNPLIPLKNLMMMPENVAIIVKILKRQETEHTVRNVSRILKNTRTNYYLDYRYQDNYDNSMKIDFFKKK